MNGISGMKKETEKTDNGQMEKMELRFKWERDTSGSEKIYRTVNVINGCNECRLIRCMQIGLPTWRC